MKTIIELTRFINNEQIDLDFNLIKESKSPLIVATRAGQIGRIKHWNYYNGPFKFSIIGWWDLMRRGYINEKGLTQEWFGHDQIIFLDPERAFDMKLYKELIDKVTNL